MGKTTGIQWAQSSWNPWYGCTKVSEGCARCYAERDMKRFGKDFDTITRSKTTFRDPLKWKEPLRVLVGSWMDFFHPDVPKEWRRDAWEIMFHAKEHTFLILTKRPENMPSMMPTGWIEGMDKYMPNIWLGVSAENQARADERILELIKIPASIHFISVEPILGPINLGLLGTIPKNISSQYSLLYERINWVITGGESGPNCRPCDLDWCRSIRDQCVEAGVSFFHKQMGGTKKIDGAWGGRELDGRTWDEIPERR